MKQIYESVCSLWVAVKETTCQFKYDNLKGEGLMFDWLVNDINPI